MIMIIKNGFNDKETILKVSTQENGSIELWIEQTGIENSRETLSYMTANELRELFVEVKRAGQDLFN